MTLMTGRQRRCTSRLAAASQLLQHSSCKRRPASPLPRRRRRVSVASLLSVRRPQDLHITLSTVEWKEGVSLNIGYSQAATCAFFTNLARWKFAYENRLVEISRDSCEKIAYERCPTWHNHVSTSSRAEVSLARDVSHRDADVREVCWT